MIQEIQEMTEEQLNSAIPVKLKEVYHEKAEAYVMKAEDLKTWAIAMFKYPTIVNGVLKVRISLAIKENDQWYNIETGLTKAVTLLEAGFLTEAEAVAALEWIEENATQEGNKHARLRLLPMNSEAYMAISLRVNRRPGENGQQGSLAKNPIAIKQLMLNSVTLERESAVVANFSGLNLPVPAKIKLTKVKVEADTEVEEEIAEVKQSQKRKTLAKGISF